MKICILASARPDFMKVSPLIRAINKAKAEGKEISWRLIYTGSKEDRSLEPSLFSDMDMKAPDVYLEINHDNLSKVAGEVMLAFEKELQSHPVHIVVLVNDLTPSMACAIVAKKKNLKVAHVVAGVRSFNINVPKEVNRIITDALSDYLFVAGMATNRNLYVSGVEDEKVYFVGNVLIDTLRYNNKRFTSPLSFDFLKLEKKKYILLTINRHTLIHNERKLKKLIEAITENTTGIPVIAPLHHYVERKINQLSLNQNNLKIIPIQPYFAFVYYLKNALAIITDSGNIAEEATFFDIPCITLNTYAEHPETISIGTNELTGEDPEMLKNAITIIKNGKWKKGNIPERWDGRTAERIIQILLNDHALLKLK